MYFGDDNNDDAYRHIALPGGKEEAQGEVKGHGGDQLLGGGRQRLRRRRATPRNLLPNHPTAHCGQLEEQPRRRRSGKCQSEEGLQVSSRWGEQEQLTTLLDFKAGFELFYTLHH